MGRREKALDDRLGPVVEFAADLRALRASAGSPPYRTMARIALFSPSVLSGAASGHRLPTLSVTLGFVAACGGDCAEWDRRWRSLRRQLVPDPPSPPPDAGATDPSPGQRNVRPFQLPIGPNHFVGRRTELADSRKAVTVSGPRVPLVIAGAVGVGKTAFASRFAHELADDFPDGQLFADLGGAGTGADRPYEVMTGFLAALGVAPDRIPPDRHHRTGLYRSMLAQRRVIVVLDNVGGESQVRPLLARSTRSQILVTSRARLLGLDQVRRITMDVFARNASMDLIGAMIGADRLQADPESGFKLAAVCEDLPLAISLAGRKIAAQPARPLSRIVAPLVGGHDSVRWLQVGDTSLADAFASAFRPLSALSLDVIHRLGRAGVKELTAGDVARSLRITVDAAELALERLVDHGLVRRAPTTDRYGMSTLVEQFSQQRTEELHRHVPSTSARRSEGDRADEFAMRRQASSMVARPRRIPGGFDESVVTASVLERPVIWIRRSA